MIKLLDTDSEGGSEGDSPSKLLHHDIKGPIRMGGSSWASLAYLDALSQSLFYFLEVAVLSSMLSQNPERVAIQQLRYLTGSSEFGPLACTLVTELIELYRC